MAQDRSPEALGRADVRRCGTLWVAEPAGGEHPRTLPDALVRVVRAGDAEPLRRAMLAAGADNPGLARVRIRGKRLGYLVESAAASTPDQSGGEVFAYGWIARPGDRVNDLGFDLVLPAGEVWIYDCATVPEARGRGLYTALLLAMRHDFTTYGIRHGWIGTAERNWASQRGIARAGFVKVADMDWNGETSIVYGVPGVAPTLLRLAAVAMADGPNPQVLPGAGVPVIEGELAGLIGDGDRLSPGLVRFQATYGEQIQWRRATSATRSEANTVTLRSQGSDVVIAADAAFEEMAHALEGIAPGIPWLDTSI